MFIKCLDIPVLNERDISVNAINLKTYGNSSIKLLSSLRIVPIANKLKGKETLLLGALTGQIYLANNGMMMLKDLLLCHL